MESIRTNRIGMYGIECLNVSDSMVRNLQMRADGIARADNIINSIVCAKCCPTRHGCTGATNCDCSYGDYHYGH